MLKEFIHELLDLDLEKTRLEQENNNLKELLEFIKESISKNATRVQCITKDDYVFDINYENVGRDICKKFIVNEINNKN